MSKIKLLLDVVENMRSLADSIQAVVEEMAGNEPTVIPDSSVIDEAPPAEPTVIRKPTMSLADVRSRLGELSRAGYTAQIRGILEKHGAARLSDVDPMEYEAILAEAEELTHAT